MQSIQFTVNLDFIINPLYDRSNISSTESSIESDIEEGQEYKECRICLESTETPSNKLMSVCGCKGSTKYVHKECIETWINMHPSNHENHKKCQICKQEFDTEKIESKYKKKKFSFWYNLGIIYFILLIVVAIAVLAMIKY